MWIGTRGGLSSYNPEQKNFTNYNIQVGNLANQAGEYVLDVTDDGNGNFYLGTGYGLKIWNQKNLQTRLYQSERNALGKLQTNLIRSVLVDSFDRVWVGTELGLMEFIPDSEYFEFYPTELDDSAVLSQADGVRVSAAVWDIFEDSENIIWTATDGFGVNWLNREENKFVTLTNDPNDNNSLNTTISRTISEDKNGDIWVGNYPSGINVFERYTAAFRTFISNTNDDNSLSYGNVKQILEDEKENLWLAVESGGLNYFDTKSTTFKYIKHDPNDINSIASDDALDMIIDKNNVMWIATWTTGISQYDLNTGEFRSILPDPNKKGALPSAHIWTVYEDSEGTIWVGAMGAGLFRYEEKTDSFKSYLYSEDDPGSILDGQIWAILEDSRGNLWIATQRALSRMDRRTERFTNFTNDRNKPDSISSNEVRAVFEDSKGRLWLGTNGGGLNQYDYINGSFSAITEHDGLNSNIIQAIVEDDDGNLWLGTANGITRYNPDTGEIKAYDKSYGLQGNEFNTGSVYKARNGDLMFGGLDGYTRFNPRELKDNNVEPAVVFTGVQILNEEVEIGESSALEESIVVADQIVLDHTQNFISIQYAALNFRNSERNQYAYKLEGFDKDWYYVDQKRTVTYTNLDAGSYRLRVKASNNEGVWNEEGSSIGILVLPPPWKTWWAYTIYVLLVFGVILSYVVTQRRINKRLELMVRDRTEELEAANKKLEKASLSDPLTGLANRRFLEKFIDADIAQVERLYGEWKKQGNEGGPPNSDIAFYLIDVDHFKHINDSYGHGAGDHVLVIMSQLLKEISRESSHVIRWGGEEFLLVSRFVDGSQAHKLAERILHSVRDATFEIETGHVLRATVSIGFSLLPYDPNDRSSKDWQKTIDIADLALYAAKHSGRNGWVGTNLSKSPFYSSSSFFDEIKNHSLETRTSFDDVSKLVWD